MTTPAALIASTPRDGSLVGSTVDGRFRVEGRLCEGGMGALYRAWDLDAECAVALKVLLPQHRLDRAARARLHSEAKTLASVRHPHVVRVLAQGELDGGHPYLVMQLLRGLDLDDYLVRHETASPDVVGEWLLPIAQALDALHSADVVHRDVKPANLFKHEEDGQTCIKLVDFGLARERASVRATAVGCAVGTPHYAAPELIEGHPGRPASDLYSLASVAYEMLCGEPPFRELRPVSILTAKVVRDAPLLSSRIGSASSTEVDALFASALARDPEQRPLGCQAFIEAVVRAAHLSWRPSALANAATRGAVGAPTQPSVRALYLNPIPEACRQRADEALQLPGLDLVTASNLVEARVHLREQPFAVFLCDLGTATDLALPFIEVLAMAGVPSVVFAEPDMQIADLPAPHVTLPATLLEALDATEFGAPSASKPALSKT